ncbi:MAG: hypothetical protein AAGI15_14930 [Pseudomonadota bacterium]
MTMVYRGLIVAMVLLFVVMGAGFWLDPTVAGARIGLEAMNPTGANALPGDFGGLFIGMAVLLLLGLWRPAAAWLPAVAVLLGTIAVGRIIGFTQSPMSDDALLALMVEVVSVAILLLAHRRLS